MRIVYRCAYRPSTNGIVERSHRTIKRIAARCEIPIWKAVYWYNVLPKRKGNTVCVPFQSVYTYEAKVDDASERPVQSMVNGDWAIGDLVFVKPDQHVRCRTRLKEGTVTRVVSDVCLEIDGVRRHEQDIRKRYPDIVRATRGVDVNRISESSSEEDKEDMISDFSEDDTNRSGDSEKDPVENFPLLSGRARLPPLWMLDYESSGWRVE